MPKYSSGFFDDLRAVSTQHLARQLYADGVWTEEAGEADVAARDPHEPACMVESSG